MHGATYDRSRGHRVKTLPATYYRVHVMLTMISLMIMIAVLAVKAADNLPAVLFLLIRVIYSVVFFSSVDSCEHTVRIFMC